MRIISIFLIACLLAPVFPGQASAQLLLNSEKSTSVNSQQLSAKGTSSGASAAGDFVLTDSIPIGAISEDYKLGPGDKLEVNLIVQDNALALKYEFLINPEGKIFFPSVGEVYLSGLTLKAAKARLSAKIKHKFKEEFELSLMVSSPKLLKVYITGLVERPGVYTVYDGSKISEIVNEVGVIPGGSTRKVKIKRGKKILNVDLYKILFEGETDSDVSVQMGDVVDVPPAGSARVTIMGEVPRPGQYELEEGEGLKDALAMAGYVGVNSALSEVAYLRRKKGEDGFDNYKLNLYDMFIKGDEAQNYELADGDIISVPAIKTYVYVYGDIKGGGRLDYIPGQRLSDYINLAGGPTPRAYLSSVTVTRQENGRPKVYRIDASRILHSGVTDKDVEILAGDVIFVPGNFFYFSDFASFANTVLLGLTLYSAFVK